MDVLLRYDGALASNNELDFYDASRALVGFQRSLALTTHLVTNGEIITQAPSLKNASIVINTPRPGSWEVVATIIGGIWAAGTASKDTPLGHLLYSVYDYVVTQTLGFPVDYNKSLFQSHQALLAERNITPAKLDSLAEKTETSIGDMHRPMVKSHTATRADIYGGDKADPKIRLGRELNAASYEFLSRTELEDDESGHVGVVSSYNINTFSGRLYDFEEQRPIPFELNDEARTRRNAGLIASSLRANAIERGDRTNAISLIGRRMVSSTGRLKGLIVSSVATAS